MFRKIQGYAAFLTVTIILTSCAAHQDSETLGQVKADLDCFEYGEGIGWKQISGKFGIPTLLLYQNLAQI